MSLPTVASLTAVSSDDFTAVSSDTPVPISVDIPPHPVFNVATDILVVEIFTRSGDAAGNGYIIGSNSAGESGASFLRAPDGEISEITALTGDLPFTQIAMSVGGNHQVPASLQSFNVD